MITEKLMKNPSFIIYCGPMFGSKTSRLLTRLDRLSYQKKKFITFKPDIDIRYNKNYITTHLGAKVQAICVKNGRDMVKYIQDMHSVIAVDEAFMIPGVADVLVDQYKKGKTVLISSLDMSATLQPFEEMEKMYRWATRIEKCPAVCTMCEKDAYYTIKKISSNNEIEVGGAELYEPRCFHHNNYIKKVM
jgi:thymidine kinase